MEPVDILLVALLVLSGWLIWLSLKIGRGEPAAAPPSAPAATPEPPPPTGPTWHALPGNQLELGDTGWRITLDVDRPDCDLVLWTPEGRCSATGREWQLDQLKRHAELCAGNRAEFTKVQADAWKP